MKVATVLRLGPDFQPKHARWLHSQLGSMPSVCLTDAKVDSVDTVPLKYPWPGWWSKLELFNPEGPLGGEDLLYLDLDTYVKSLGPLVRACKGVKKLVALSDFYHPDFLASGVMWIPVEAKERVWNAFMNRPNDHITAYRPPGRHGDQGFIGQVFPDALRWDAIAPERVVSYKRDVATREMPGFHPTRSRGTGRLPRGASVVCFHGNPRPWECNLSFVPRLLD